MVLLPYTQFNWANSRGEEDHSTEKTTSQSLMTTCRTHRAETESVCSFLFFHKHQCPASNCLNVFVNMFFFISVNICKSKTTKLFHRDNDMSSVSRSLQAITPLNYSVRAHEYILGFRTNWSRVNVSSRIKFLCLISAGVWKFSVSIFLLQYSISNLNPT